MALVFKKYYQEVFLAVVRLVLVKSIAEDLAQDVMYEFWKNHKTIGINSSLGAYLRRAGVNRALNYLRDNKQKWESDEELDKTQSSAHSARELVEQVELEQLVNHAIDSLPERCRLVFVLSRFEELTYQEIADKLDISPKTVEHQISKALRLLRQALGGYLENRKL